MDIWFQTTLNLYYVSANTCLNHLKLLRRKLQDIMQKIFEKIGCHIDDVGPRPLQPISWNEA